MFELTPFTGNNPAKKSSGNDAFYSLMDSFFNDSFPSMRNLRNDTFKIDLKEDEEAYTVEAELPGVSKNEIDIEFNDDRLMISVNREEKINEEKENYIHRERRKTSMQRGLILKDVAWEKIDAKLEDGLLTVKLPKSEKAISKRKIQIK